MSSIAGLQSQFSEVREHATNKVLAGAALVTGILATSAATLGVLTVAVVR